MTRFRSPAKTVTETRTGRSGLKPVRRKRNTGVPGCSASAASEQVSTNVQTVAAASEQMGKSIREIAASSGDAARVAQEAVGVASRGDVAATREAARELAGMSSRVCDEVSQFQY